jgi:predicted ribonuclease YlaK
MAKKREVKINITLNEEQKNAKALILNSKITVLKGGAGSGKTLLSVATALDQLLKGTIKKIIVTRPLVTSGNEDLGFNHFYFRVSFLHLAFSQTYQ